MRELRWRVWWIAAGVALVLSVTWLCLRPSGGSEPLFPHADKWAHFVAFFALGGFLLALVERRGYAVLCAGLVVFGGVIEVAQYLMPYGRSAEWADLAADALGVAAGLGLSLAIRRSWLQVVEGWMGARG